jgi:hypothetical protein
LKNSCDDGVLIWVEANSARSIWQTLRMINPGCTSFFDKIGVSISGCAMSL